jgi:predicted nucleic acid-binding protein
VSTYLDASFLVSLYSAEPNQVLAARSIARASFPLLISDLAEFEMDNSFRLRVFRKDATEAQALRSHLDFEQDLREEIMERFALDRGTYLRGHALSARYTAQLGTRGADILHVAAALEAGSTAFFSFDTQQRRLAEAVGLAMNPL